MITNNPVTGRYWAVFKSLLPKKLVYFKFALRKFLGQGKKSTTAFTTASKNDFYLVANIVLLWNLLSLVSIVCVTVSITISQCPAKMAHSSLLTAFNPFSCPKSQTLPYSFKNQYGQFCHNHSTISALTCLSYFSSAVITHHKQVNLWKKALKWVLGSQELESMMVEGRHCSWAATESSYSNPQGRCRETQWG